MQQIVEIYHVYKSLCSLRIIKGKAGRTLFTSQKFLEIRNCYMSDNTWGYLDRMTLISFIRRDKVPRWQWDSCQLAVTFEQNHACTELLKCRTRYKILGTGMDSSCVISQIIKWERLVSVYFIWCTNLLIYLCMYVYVSISSIF